MCNLGEVAVNRADEDQPRMALTSNIIKDVNQKPADLDFTYLMIL